MNASKDAFKVNSSIWGEVFGYLSSGGRSFLNGNDVIENYRRKSYQYLSLILNADRSVQLTSKILVVGLANLRELREVFDNEEILCLGGLRDGIKCRKFDISFVSDCLFKDRLYKSWINDDLQKIDNLKVRISNLLISKNINKVIVSSDSLPLERLVICTAKSLGIKTFCIQHGLFSRKVPDINDGRYADSILCYDNYQRSILLDCGAINPIAIGYPFASLMKSECQDRETVLFFGQPWSRYYADKDEIYISIVERVKKICEEFGIEFKYKPHPSENINISKKIDKLILHKGDLQSALDNNFIFCSISSTALLQASLAGKLAFQIMDQNFIEEKYENFRYCYSISIQDKYKFIEYIKYGMPIKIYSDNKRSLKLQLLLRDNCESDK